MSVTSRSSRPLRTRRGRRLQAFPEGLESRIVLSTFDVSSEAALRSAIATADSNPDSSNIIDITSSITLTDTSAGQLEIQNATSGAKTLTIEGLGAAPSSTVVDGSSSWATRIFEVAGTGAASVTVIFKDMEIAGGRAENGGVLGGTAALGGGLLIDGGQVTLSHVSIQRNHASGAFGAGRCERGGRAPGQAGTAGSNGGAARGGGIYLAAGN